MVEVCNGTTSQSLVCDVLKVDSGQVGKEDMGVMGWFSVDFFWNVTDGEVDGIGSFILEHGFCCLI